MKHVVITLLSALPMLAQSGTPVRVEDVPPAVAIQEIPVISGSNTVAICFAPSILSTRINRTISISAATNANPVVFTSTAHGFDTNSRPTVVISGGTGNWTAVNGTFVATIVDANTFSIPVDSTALGALAGTVTFTSLAPRKNQYEWAVKQFAYDANNNVVFIGWLNGTTAYVSRCSDATATTVARQ